MSNGEPGVDQPKPSPIQRFDVTHHHWNISDFAQGLRIIGYGFMAIAVSIVIVGAMLVTYWNAQ